MEKKNINVPTHSITTLAFEDRCQNVLLAGFHDSGKNEFALLPLLAQDCMDRATGVIIAATENHLPKAAAEMATPSPDRKMKSLKTWLKFSMIFFIIHHVSSRI